MPQKMADGPAKLKCRFASNSIPQTGKLGRNGRRSEFYAQRSCPCIHRRHSGTGAGTGFPNAAALGDHAALSRYMNGAVMQVSHRHVYARRYAIAPRRYNWRYYPYWRPYQYYYWHHYYPYGGPLF